MMKISKNIRLLLFGMTSTVVLSSCSKLYDLPEDRDFISENIDYLEKVIEPVLGRNNLMTSLQADNSTLPLQFEIVNPRYGDGRPFTDLFTTVQTYEWIGEYDGLETSLEEIEAKRQLVEKPAFEVDSNGRFILWSSATEQLITPRPADTVLRTQDVRFFDLKVSNSGGVRLIKDFQVIPWRERPYYPDTDINPYTGGTAPDPQRPRDTTRQDYIIPSVITNVIGEGSELPLVNNTEKKTSSSISDLLRVVTGTISGSDLWGETENISIRPFLMKPNGMNWYTALTKRLAKVMSNMMWPILSRLRTSELIIAMEGALHNSNSLIPESDSEALYHCPLSD